MLFTHRLSAFIVKEHTNFSHETQTYGEGQVLSLLTGEADFALAATTELTVKHDRIQFNLPIDKVKLVAVFRKSVMSRDPLAKARPLSAQVWLAMICWVALNMAALIICKVTTTLLDNMRMLMSKGSNGNAVVLSRALGLQRLGWWKSLDLSTILSPLTLLCSKGLEEFPAENSLRTIVTTVGAIAAVFNMVYGARLLSFLTVDTLPYGNIEQLLGTSYKFGAYSVDVAETMFKVRI